MKTVLITGVAGFLGSHIAQRCFENGWKVVGIDSMEGGVASNIPPSCTFHQMDICDGFAIKALFAKYEFEAVIHCAAFASENLSHNCRLHTHRSIVIGSATLVNAAVNSGVELFVSMSSIAVYGKGVPPFSEVNTPTLPCDPYGAAKLCMEHDLMAASENFGMRHIIFRPHNIIGTRQNMADRTRNVAAIFIRQLFSGQPLTIFGDGRQTRAWSPVSQVAGLIAASIDRPASWDNTYNVGGESVMKVWDLAHIICEIAGVKPEIEFLPARNEAKHAHSFHSRAKQFFPDFYGAGETIENCLRSMLNEAKTHAPAPLQPLPTIEIAAKLNPSWTSQH